MCGGGQRVMQNTDYSLCFVFDRQEKKDEGSTSII